MKRSLVLTTLLWLLISGGALATHIRAGEVTAVVNSCSQLSYTVFITLYLDTDGIEPGNGYIFFNDGSPVEALAEVGKTPDFEEPVGDRIRKVVYIRQHTFPGPGTYTIGFMEENRNDGILNINASVTQPFYVETQLTIDPLLGCDNTPQLLNPPIDEGCIGVTYLHNAGAIDIDGDSISYEFVNPRRSRNEEVSGYQFPHIYDINRSGTQNQDGTGPATFTLNEETGDIIWDAPGNQGEYNFAFKIITWKRINGQWLEYGYIVRDMQVTVRDCENEKPELIIPNDTCVVAGALIEAEILAIDPNGDSVKITSFGEVYEPPVNPRAQFSPTPAILQASPAVAQFSWQTTCNRIRNLPYYARFKAADTLNGPQLADFKNWAITVVGPPPENLVAAQGDADNIELTWDDYGCTNAQTLKIYRRVDSYDFTPGNCELGIPPNAGYELIAEVPATTTDYIDNDPALQSGVNYCYRIVATFMVPDYMESIVSDEVCVLIMDEKDALITNVSVLETSETTGRIFVRWTSPFGIDQGIYPPPYSYDVYRGEGFSTAGTELVRDNITDTLFTDDGLNTLNRIYNYHLVYYDGNGEAIDTSALASSVRNDIVPLNGALEISWQANTPWSNFAQDHPMHLIYRDNIIPGEPQQLLLLDSVNVFDNGLLYLDDGSASGEAGLDEEKEYCYYVVTRGTYGNDNIATPLENFSQIICAQPNDTIPPCGPSMIVLLNDCEDLRTQECDFDNYQNELAWSFDLSEECGLDVRGFNVYYSPTGEEEDFSIIAQAVDTFFIHRNISSYKGCYKITAVDRSGNESEATETICADNCPFYFLPNVFTPNNDSYNDTFQAYDATTWNTDAPFYLCPRFVESVKFEVFSRWGNLVYDYQSGGENTIFIHWNGVGNNGKPVSAGTYYYVATVTFDMLDPRRRVQEFKGWLMVHREN